MKEVLLSRFSKISFLLTSLASTHLTYACQVRGQKESKTLKRLIKLQTIALKLMFFDKNSPTNKLFKNANILKFNDHVILENCLFTYNYLNHSLPDAFDNILKRPIHDHITRATTHNAVVLPQVTTSNYGLNSILYRCAKDWNEQNNLHSDLRLSTSKVSFKNKLKKTPY